jgi:hypothetical protein
MIRWLAYIFVCHLGWNCRRNFEATLGCVSCHRTAAQTMKGRRLR